MVKLGYIFTVFNCAVLHWKFVMIQNWTNYIL